MTTKPDRGRGPGAGSRRAGLQRHTSIRYSTRLLDAGARSASIGAVGDSYDNALAESLIGLYKTE